MDTIAYPTDARLYHTMRGKLMKVAKRWSVGLRQSYERVSKKALMLSGRYFHARQAKRAKREVRKLKTWLGKASFVSTSRECFVLGALGLHDNPYDGHTLPASMEQAQRLCGSHRIREAFVDRGYRGSGYEGEVAVHICDGNKRKNLSSRLKRLRKRRSAIEPLIGHMKNDGRLGRNYLLGKAGDRMNVILCACGQNLRLLLNHILRSGSLFSLFATLLAAFFHQFCHALRDKKGAGGAQIGFQWT